MKTILVTGATGKQGGSVVALLHSEYRVRALVRNADSEAADRMKRLGVALAIGDLRQPASLHPALQGVDYVFSVQDFRPRRSKRSEL